MLSRSSAGIERVFERLDAIYDIGATRVAYSAEEDAAHDVAAAWMEAAGLEVERDDDGNLIGRLRGRRPELPEVWSGSHLDSVPNGGRFDGALGVVAALEAVEAVGPQARTLGAAVFRGEETGCLGSRARCGGGLLPGRFVEVHVEQGPRLELAGAPLGVVTSIVGYARREVWFSGRTGHAGTTPMDAREDALAKAAECVLRVKEVASSIDGAVGTVGTIEVPRGAVNVVPGSVRLTVDLRAPDNARLDRLLRELELDAEPRTPPAALDERVRAVLRAEVERLGLPVVELPSGAGHDAGILAAAGVASGMLFVRSLNGGVSHSPEERSSQEDIALALDALTGALRSLGRE